MDISPKVVRVQDICTMEGVPPVIVQLENSNFPGSGRVSLLSLMPNWRYSDYFSNELFKIQTEH